MAMNSITSGTSEKNARNENFPVASFLLPKHMRGHVMAFYNFARNADDVADEPNIGSDEKLSILDDMEKTLLGTSVGGDVRFSAAATMRQSLSDSGISAIHCRNLLKAFRQDAVKSRYYSWQELMDYCSLSAAPVGRYLMDISGNSSSDKAPSDALCAALQVLNHLQDTKADYLELNRVYIPLDWMTEEGASASDLAEEKMTPQLKRVQDRMIVEIDKLLLEAAPLGRSLSGPLGREASGIRAIAQQLSAKLKHTDPLSNRVELGKIKSLFYFFRGAIMG